MHAQPRPNRNPRAATLALAIVAGSLCAVFAKPPASRSASPKLNPSRAPQIAPPPADSFELVTTPPKPMGSAVERNQAVGLLRDALWKMAFVAHPTPFTVDVNFTAGGSVQETGPGEMEETRNSAGNRLWIGRLGNYQITRLIVYDPHYPAPAPGRFYDSGSPGPIPIRLHMVRLYVLGVQAPPLLENIRTANGRLQGGYLTCVLVAPTPVAPTGAAEVAALGNGDPEGAFGAEETQAKSGRAWEEEEYCVDPSSGLLRVYSPAPGIYVQYDYDSGAEFHGHAVPERFSVAEAGNLILQGALTVRDPGPLELLKPADDSLRGGVELQWPSHRFESRPSSADAATIEPVVVHVITAPDGHVVEAEALQSPNSPSSQSAVSFVKSTKFDSTIHYPHPRQDEIFVTVE